MAGAQISAGAGRLICWRGEEGEAGKAGEEIRGRRQVLEKSQKREGQEKLKALGRQKQRNQGGF